MTIDDWKEEDNFTGRILDNQDFVLRNIINGDCRIMDWSPSNSDSLKCFNLCRHYTKGARSRRNDASNITTKPTITFSFKIFAGGNSIIYIPLKALLRSLCISSFGFASWRRVRLCVLISELRENATISQPNRSLRYNSAGQDNAEAPLLCRTQINLSTKLDQIDGNSDSQSSKSRIHLWLC